MLFIASILVERDLRETLRRHTCLARIYLILPDRSMCGPSEHGNMLDEGSPSSFSEPHILGIRQRCGRKKKKAGKRKLNNISTHLKTRGYHRDPSKSSSIVGGFPLNPFQKHMAGFESLNGICQPSVNL